MPGTQMPSAQMPGPWAGKPCHAAGPCAALAPAQIVLFLPCGEGEWQKPFSRRRAPGRPAARQPQQEGAAQARGQRGADRQAVQFFDTPRAFPARQWMVLIQGHGRRATSPACAGGAVWRGGLPLLSAAGPGTGWRRTCGACPGSLEAWAGRGARQPQPGACGAPQGALRAWRCAGPAVQGQGG